MRSLAGWLAWMERCHPRKIELGLERTAQVRDRLGLADLPFPVITVTGTNGKGSTVAFLEAILTAAGYRCGVYTSPHLIRYNERVRIEARDASDDALVAAFLRVDAARTDPSYGEVSLTYFEFGTLAAMSQFHAAAVEVVILEVGLGGRLDAVNVWDADVAVVTAVGIDHTEWLGDTREQIGYEKAGLFRAGRPAVCGDPDPPMSLMAHAQDIGARCLRVRHDFDFEVAGTSAWTWRGPTTLRAGLPWPSLRGTHQLYNASAALMALDTLSSRLPVPQQAVREGLLAAGPRARFQTLPGLPLRVLDVAHNAHAAHALADTLRTQPCPGLTLAVCGMLGDKPIRETLAELVTLVSRWHLCALAGERAAPPGKLADVLRGLSVPVEAIRFHPDPVSAWRTACSEAGESDRVLAFGSFHTVGDILAALEKKAF